MHPLESRHLGDMIDLYNDPAVTRFLAPLDEDGHRRRLLESEESWRVRGYGRAAVYETGSGELVGRGGLTYWPDFGEVEVGWVLRRKFWRRGYATEAARAWARWALDHLEVDYATANIDPGNAASLAVAARLDMTPLRRDTFHGRQVIVHAIHRRSEGDASPSRQ